MEEAEYPLAHSYRAAARFNLQHYIWTQSNGYLLHPDIPLTDGITISGIGTRTGIWLTDLAGLTSNLTGIQLHGFVIDISQCPSKEWLFKNMFIRELDIFGHISDELHGQYDIINVRFFLYVIKKSNPELVLQQLLRMLKPNGWIQWAEQDLKTARIVAAKPDSKPTYTEALMDFATAPTPSFTAESQFWVADLHQTFRNAGLLDVKEDRTQRPLWSFPSFQDSALLTVEEMSLRRPNGSEVRQMISKAAREFGENKRGVTIVADNLTVIGRKAAWNF